MEKNRATHSAPKAANSDCRGKQDGLFKYSRFPRYKESSSPHSESRRKPNPQKNRDVFDKRPRTRVGTVFEKSRSQVAEAASNYENSPKQGSRKTNLNHLLNFTLMPTDNRLYNGRRVTFTKNKLPKYNKELFLQANFQFVTRDDGDYRIYCENPDILVEWSLIEEVRLPSHEVPSCPICLYPPVAAKITRCGHIYCWPCILHYLALTDKSWQKCPICFESIHKADLKSVLPTTQRKVAVGDEITMCLMKRERGTLFPVPASETSLVSACKVSDDEKITRFQKLLLASKPEVCSIINRERQELQKQYAIEKDTPEICFIESALEQLDIREHLLNEGGESEVLQSTTLKSENASHTSELQALDCENNGSFEEHIGSPHANNFIIPTEDVTVKENINTNPEIVIAESEASPSVNFQGTETAAAHQETPFKDKAYYFYQAEDGQHIYMHNINVRMLVKEFGSLECSPNIITTKIVELENASMNEALRKRLRYLQHIPLTSEFQFAELNLRSYLSKVTNEEFTGEVTRRRNQRNRKAREEMRREKNIEEEENKKLGKYPSPTFNLSSADQFPMYNPNNNSQLSNVNLNIGYEIQYPVTSVSSNSVSDEVEKNSNMTSFAQMLREGPSTFTEHHLPSSNKIVNDHSNVLKQQQQDSDEEECVSVPEYRRSFSNALQQALDAAIIGKDLPGNKMNSKKKKKKEKNTVLFTTSMHRCK